MLTFYRQTDGQTATVLNAASYREGCMTMSVALVGCCCVFKCGKEWVHCALLNVVVHSVAGIDSTHAGDIW